MTVFSRDDVVIESVSMLRFRDRPEIEASLVDHGFELAEIRHAPDRPGFEFVFLSRRSPRARSCLDAGCIPVVPIRDAPITRARDSAPCRLC
jgi:hypothetical protein